MSMAKKVLSMMGEKRGRPAGTTAAKRVEGTASLPRCPVCGSTQLKVIRETRPPMLYDGVDDQGRPYNRIRWKRCDCQACGAHPVMRVLEYDGPTPKVSESTAAASRTRPPEKRQ